MEIVVCELSGGADSTLAAIQAQERWPTAIFYGVFVDYGQVCAKQEKRCALRAANKLKLHSLRIVNIQGLWSGGGMIDGESATGSVYTSLRNVVILSIAVAYADSIGANRVVTGSKGFSKVDSDPHSYYDSTIPFYKLMEAVWNYTAEIKRRVEIVPILAEGRSMKMSKERVYEELLKHGFKFEDTWSCFRGEDEECGKCHNCLIKKKIFAPFH